MDHALPADRAQRRSTVAALRPALDRTHDPWRAHGIAIDDEPDEKGQVVRAATVFLTGGECPWQCVMCDLWQYTTTTPTPPGAIAAQVATAMQDISARGGADHIKLYNAGSFFDPRAVPDADVPAVVDATRGASRVIVESHPALIGERTSRLIDHLHAIRPGASAPILEVAMGLETAHPEALRSLDKGLTVDQFHRAADRLRTLGAGLRVFLLVHPPFVPVADRDDWLARSIDEAIAAGADVISLIPTRTGNGVMDRLAAEGAFTPPDLADLEGALAVALARPRPARTRILADLWDASRLPGCAVCGPARIERLRQANLTQRLAPLPACDACVRQTSSGHASLPREHRN